MYKKLEKERVAFFDCDDTLILWDNEKYGGPNAETVDFGDDTTYFPIIPHIRNIELLKKLKLQGYGIVIWSAAGAEWAEKVTKKLKLEEYTDFVMAKPEICVDDLLDAKRIIKSVIWLDPETGEYKRNT